MSKENHEQEEPKSDKKDPELFENEPVDIQPSRKGRIVSTLIVIVVAILVIWVFARNNKETPNETAKEETAAAEPLNDTSVAANEATNPEDQLAVLQSEFDTSWQATTDEISNATEMAVTNFDDKKTAALERLTDVTANLQNTATKTIDQGLASAKNKVVSLSQTNLKSLTALQAKIAAKTKVDQLETAVADANDKLAQSKDQVMAAINENTDKLTATIDQAVTKALDQNENSQQLGAQSKTETEVTVAEDDSAVTAEPVTEEPTKEEVTVTGTKPATVTGEGIEVTAERGDSITKLARKALTEAMDSGKVSKDLSAEQRIYIEDYMQNRTGSQRVSVGDSQTFSSELMNEAVDHAQNLSDAQREHLKIYSSRVSF